MLLALFLSSLFLESKFLVVLEVERVEGWFRRKEVGYIKACIVRSGSPQSSCFFIAGDPQKESSKRKITQRVTWLSLQPPGGSRRLCLHTWDSEVE